MRCSASTAQTARWPAATYERGDHIRDVRTGLPASAAASATVCGPDLAVADALATGLIAAGEAGMHAVQQAGYEALIVFPDESETHACAFPLLLSEYTASSSSLIGANAQDLETAVRNSLVAALSSAS